MFPFRPVPSEGKSDAQCSLYMRELQGFISRAYETYLTQFECTDFIMDRYETWLQGY